MRSCANISLEIPNSHETLLHHIIGKENGDEILKVCIENSSYNGVFYFFVHVQKL